MRAQKIQHKAAKVGFDWENVDGAVDKLYEEIDELKTAMAHNDATEIEDEFGDVLFSCVNISRFIGVDSEEALTKATDKFLSRFAKLESMAKEQGIDIKNSSIAQLNTLWDQAKILTD
jgi:tetrapyrrole methylase family protein/MazG family protein